MLMSSPRGDLSPRSNTGRAGPGDRMLGSTRSPRKTRGTGGSGKRDEQTSPRVGPGVPRRPRRQGQVAGLNVNADDANRARGVVQPLWTMPHARAREAIAAAQLRGSGDHFIQSPSRPANTSGHFAAKPSPRTRRFFFDTPSPRSVGTSGTGNGTGGGASHDAGSSRQDRHSRVSKSSKVSEVSRASRVTPPPSESPTAGEGATGRRSDASGRGGGNEGASEDGKTYATSSATGSSISSFNDPRSPRPDDASSGGHAQRQRRRRPRRKGVAMTKGAVRADLKLDLRGIGSHHASERGGARSHRSGRAAPLSARLSGRSGGPSAFTPRRRAVPSLNDYASGGVLDSARRARLDGGGSGSGSTPRSGRSGHHPSPSPPSQGGPTPRRTPRVLPLARGAHADESPQQGGIAEQQPNTVPRARANVRALRVLGNARNSPRGVMAMLAARNAGERPQSQQGSRSAGGAHGGRVRRGQPVVARPPVPTPATNGLNGPATGGSGSGDESPAGSARRNKRVHLTPLRLDFASATVRPSPLSAQPRRATRPAGLQARAVAETPKVGGQALPPLRTGLTRTVRSPTDDRGDLLSHGRRARGMVIRADSTDGEVLLSGRRGSAAKLTPLNAGGRSRLNNTGTSTRSHSSASSYDAGSPLTRGHPSPPRGMGVASSGASSPSSAMASARSKQEQVLRAGTPKTGARTLRPLADL